MSSQPKRHITARVAEDVAQAIDRRAEDLNLGKSIVIERLIRAGLEAQESGEDHAGEGADQTPTDAGGGPSVASHEAVGGHGADGDAAAELQAMRAAIEALKASNADLRAALVDARATTATLVAQLETKDRQIERAHDLADHAQKLHAAEVQKMLPAEGQTRGGWIHSLFRRH